jgi:hypothetical protein
MSGRTIGKVAIGSALAFVLFGPSRPARACACKEPAVGRAYARADLVIVASIEHVGRNSNSELVATAQVREAWKSPVPVTFAFESEATDCEYEVREKETHLLFLHRGESGAYWTTLCQGNLMIDRASRSLAWLKRHALRAAVGAPAARQ